MSRSVVFWRIVSIGRALKRIMFRVIDSIRHAATCYFSPDASTNLALLYYANKVLRAPDARLNP